MRNALGRRGWLALAAAALLALSALLALGSSEAPADAGKARAATPPALNLLLRLHDLPPGYRLLDFGISPEYDVNPLFCEPVKPANARPRLDDFLQRYSPFGCLAVYLRLFRVPGLGPSPPLMGTGAMETGSVEGAEAAMKVSRELLSHLLNDELPEEVPSPEVVGDATRLFHWHHPPLLQKSEKEDATFLVWRSGAVVAAVFASGSTSAVDDQAALDAARLQQGRIENPTPVASADFDSAEVALEAPGLEVPVYWLGRPFAPGRGLPKLLLYDSWSTTSDKNPRHPRVGLIYTDHLRLEHAETLELELWSPEQWRKMRKRGLELPGSLRCGSSHQVPLPQGRAVISSGYEAESLEWHGGACPKHQPKIFVVRAFLPGAVVTAQTLEICETCAEPGTGPYDSFKGMATVAHSLKRWGLRPAG